MHYRILLCQVGGVATRLPAEQLYSRSNRELGFGDYAAIAERFHPDPFRTRQLSSLASTTVLRYASSRELVNAATPFLLLKLILTVILNTKAQALCFLKSQNSITESILPLSETIFILGSNSILYHNGIPDLQLSRAKRTITTENHHSPLIRMTRMKKFLQ